MEKHLHTKIESTLNSLDGVKRAEANPYLFTRIMAQMTSAVKPILRPRLIWQMTASMILILGVNIAIGLYVFNNKKQGPAQTAENGYFTQHIYNY